MNRILLLSVGALLVAAAAAQTAALRKGVSVQMPVTTMRWRCRMRTWQTP